MMQTIKVLVISAVISTGIFGCSATQETTTKRSADPAASNTPSWYQKTAFQTDSTSFTGYGEAVASDSIMAIENAEVQARVNLESGVSEIVEETRNSLLEGGNETVSKPEFLIMLRNASQTIQDEGSVTNKTAIKKDGYFRGYVTVKVSRSDARNVLNSGFEANPEYWNILSSESVFE
jgi:hypothetical protein